MKKLYFVFVLIALLAGCKKSNQLAEVSPEPEPTGAVTAAEFLRGLNVPGAESIRFDSTSNSYFVNFPDGYVQDKAEVRLALQPSIALEDSLGKPSADSVLHYNYRGTSPLQLNLKRKIGSRAFSFQVYFKFSGTPQIELLEKQIQVFSYHTQLALRFGKNVGSIPSGPNRLGPLVNITNNKTGKTIRTSFQDEFGVISFAGQELISEDLMKLEITLENQQPVVFEGVRFIRGRAVIYPSPSYKYQYRYTDTLQFTADNLLPGQRYSVRFSNEYMDQPVVASVRVADSSRLFVDKIPADLPEGSYSMSFYQSDKLIAISTCYLSDHETDAIESIWKGDLYGATGRNVDPLSVTQGESFYVTVSPFKYGYHNSDFDVSRLPSLRLRLGGEITELHPELVVFHWGIAGISLGFGRFTIPKNLPSGNYEARGLFVNKSESKPYWSKLRVLMRK